MPDKPTHRILIVTTGGTIAGNVAEQFHDLDLSLRAVGSADIMRMIAPTKAHLETRLGKTIALDTHPLCDIDSSNITPDHWMKLASVIYDRFDDYEAFIVTHGTNTLSYTAAALSFAIANSGKPIILTGSQVPAGLPGTDALTNLDNAIRVACWGHATRTGSVEGVIVVFGSHIIAGTRAKKATEFDYDAFVSFKTDSIGRIGRLIDVNTANLSRHCGYLRSGRFPIATRQRELVLDNEFNTSIATLTEFPGMSPRLFQTLVERENIEAFILRTYGAGDPCEALRPAFAYLKQSRIPIVVTTQAPAGNSTLQVNEAGRWLRENDMAIPAYDMSIEAQTTKLAWLLAKKAKHEITYRGLCTEMVTDLRGEIRVLWEVGAERN